MQEIKEGDAFRVTATNVNELVLANTVATKLTQNYLTLFGNSILNSKYNFGIWFCAVSKGDFLLYKNAAVGGDNTTDMLARLSDIPSNSDTVLVMEAANDAGANSTVEAHTSNIKSIFEYIISIGARPMMVLSPPNDDIPRSILIDEMNQSDIQLCRDMDIACFDPWDDSVQPDGSYKPNLTSNDDGTHPNGQLHMEVGDKLYNQVVNRQYATLRPRINGQGIMPNSLLMLDNGGNTDIPSTFWRAGQVSASLSETSLGKGRTWSVNFADNGGTITSSQFPLDSNTQYMFVCNISASFNSGGSSMRLVLEPDVGSYKYVFDSVVTDIAPNKLVILFTLDDTQSSARLKFSVSSGVFDLDVNLAEIQIYKVS